LFATPRAPFLPIRDLQRRVNSLDRDPRRRVWPASLRSNISTWMSAWSEVLGLRNPSLR